MDGDTDLSCNNLHGKTLGSIFNNDVDSLLQALPPSPDLASDYRRGICAILDLRPGVLAQNVGWPDPVSYSSRVATNISKHIVEVTRESGELEITLETASRLREVLARLLDSGTDPLQLTAEVCRERGTPLVASYRMNDEHWYEFEYLLSDLGRRYPEWRIPFPEAERNVWTHYGDSPPEFTGSLDPAIPGVYEHRMKMFTEVAENYDIDGIEFDFRRWHHMVSDPLENYGVLTRMVRDTRRMLDDVSKSKGGGRMILGVRVAPSLDTDPNFFIYPGNGQSISLLNASCRQLGLDVRTWVAEEIVDYVCPSLWNDALPGLPLTREFAELAKGTRVGVYPTIWPVASWQGLTGGGSVGLGDDDITQRAQSLFKYDLCSTLLKAYADGADGVSTYNWFCYLRTLESAQLWHDDGWGNLPGPAAEAIERYIYPILGDPDAIRRYMDETWAVPSQ